MVPNVAKAGSSFKGAFAYYLHDKRIEGEAIRDTSERVAWTETRNLATDDPELSARIMAATAMDQERLKREAGIKNSGRKSSNSVYAYSLAWHPDETGKIDRTEMLRAADESLRAIGAQDRQAVIVAHSDEPHPHVHVILNRVSMEDGRMMPTSNDYKKLDAWALAYRRERGEEQLYCPARAEKAEAIKRKVAGEKVEFVRGEKTTPRAMEPDFAKARAANDNSALAARDQQKGLNAELSANARTMKERHAAEWSDLTRRYREKKAEIDTQAKAAIERTKVAIDKQYEPARRSLHAGQYEERQAFDARETRLAGKIRNMIDAIRHRKVSGAVDEDRGWTAASFNFLTSQKARAAALERLHAVQARDLTRQQRAEIGAAIAGIKTDRTALLSSTRSGFNAERTALIERQAGEREQIRKGWQQRRKEVARVFDTLRRSAEVRKARKARQQPRHAMKQESTRAEHKAASEGRRKSTGRSRTRKRTRGDD
ncbi:relaxase/mobilization nuclease domain-containing protein [Hoeflea sp. CAU 1731]